MTQNSTLVEKFQYKGKTCLVVQVSNIMDVYHNGYVKVADEKEEVDIKRREDGMTEGYDITYEQFIQDTDADEPTFSGMIKQYDAPDGYYIGFDSAHIWNDQNPETKGHLEVKSRLKQMVDDFIDHNVFKKVRKDNGRPTCENDG